MGSAVSKPCDGSGRGLLSTTLLFGSSLFGVGRRAGARSPVMRVAYSGRSIRPARPAVEMGAVESEENQKQVFSLFPPPLEIAKRRDVHIPTAATAILSFLTSNPKEANPTHSHAPHPFEVLSSPTPPRTECPLPPARPYPHQTAKRLLFAVPGGVRRGLAGTGRDRARQTPAQDKTNQARRVSASAKPKIAID